MAVLDEQVWQRVKAVFDLAVERPAAERAAVLDEACGGDAGLRSRVESLLAAHEEEEAAAGSPTVGPDRLPGEASGGAPETPGARIGPYKLLEQIGEGAFGLVFLAEQEQPIRRRVALKIVKAGMDTRQVIARFDAERQVLALMDHPNIARVLDAGTTETGRPYFVMELVRGRPITQYCDDRKLSPRERLELFIAVCQAVQHAHQKGIIHRDIKPSNVLVAVADDRPVPKVIDFGVAKALYQKLTDRTLFTGLQQMIGTPTYMSPEQAELGAVDIDTRSDIYSLGVLLYELLTGTTPFDAETLRSASFDEMRRIIRDVAPPMPSTRVSALMSRPHATGRDRSPGDSRGQPSPEDHAANDASSVGAIARHRDTDPATLRRVLHGDLDWIVMKCLEKDRERRYQTANVLAAEIARHLNGEPIEAKRDSMLYVLKKTLRRHRLPVAVAAGFVALVTVGLIATTLLWHRATHERGRAEAAERQADARAEQLRRTVYFNHVALAANAHDAGQIGRMEDLLYTCPADLRGWEWYFLLRLSGRSRSTLRGHADSVMDAVFSPDGQRIASASKDGTVRLWDVKTGRLEATLAGHQRSVRTVAFSPDGKRIVSGSEDKTVKLWDAQTGREVLTFRGHENQVCAVAFSPDGRQVASGAHDGSVRLWDASTGRDIRRLCSRDGPRHCFAVAFSPDGTRLAGGYGESGLEIWSAAAGEQLLSLRGHSDEVRAVAFSPDGRRLASGSADDTVKVWDLDTGRELRTLIGHLGRVDGVAYSPDGRRVVSASEDRTLKVWDTDTGRELRTLGGHGGRVFSVAFSPDGARMVSASEDRTLRLWDPDPPPDVHVLSGHAGEVNALAFSPDGKRIVCGGAALKVWDAETGRELRVLAGHAGSVNDAAFSPDGKRIGAAAQDSTLRLWDAETGQELRTFRGHSGPVGDIAFSPDGAQLASASEDLTVRLWNAATGRELRVLRGHQEWAHTVAFSPDGCQIVSGGHDKTVRLWDAATGRELWTLRGHQACVPAVAFSPDGRQIASGSYDTTIRLWNARTGQEVLIARGHADRVCAVAFSPDGQRIVSAGVDKTVRLWDTATGHEALVIRGCPAGLSAVAFSPDGRRVAAGDAEGTIRIWEAAAPDEVARAPDIAYGLVRGATCLTELKQYEEAEPLLREALALHEKVSGAASPEALATMGSLETCLRELGRRRDADALRQRRGDLARMSGHLPQSLR